MTLSRSALVLLAVVYAGFISLGLPDGTLGVAWPQAYPELGVPIGMAGTLLTVITLLAAVSGFQSGRIIARFHTGPVVLVSCVLTGSALLLFSRVDGILGLYLASLPLGIGAGAVDAGLNGFVARHYSGRHMNWLHACWGVGATCGPLIMGWMIAEGLGWRRGYAVLGLAQLSLALVFLLTLRLWRHVPQRSASDEARESERPSAGHAANSFVGWLSPALFAVYVAGELVTGVWAGTSLVVGRGFSAEVAAVGTASYFAAITAGRIAAGLVVGRWGNRRLVFAGSLLALLGAIGFAVGSSVPILLLSLVLLGLGLAPIYPGLMHEVPRRFAPEAVQTVIGRQSGAAYLGAAIVPAAAGALAAHSLDLIPWLVVVAILVLIAGLRLLDQRS